MQNALKVLPSTQTMSSIEVVSIINGFRDPGKPELQHKHFLEKVKKVIGEPAEKMAGQYKAGNGQLQPCYYLPKRECQLMVMSESYKVQAEVYDKLSAMEEKPVLSLPTNFIEALEALVISEKEKQSALTKIETDRPKVEFAIAVRNMQGACSVGDFAKAIGYGRNKFFKMMRDDGILIKNNVPYQKYIDMGCFVVMEQIPYTDSNGKTHPAFTTMITGKGQVFLEKKYRKDAV